MNVVEEIHGITPEIVALSTNAKTSGLHSPSHWHNWYEVVLIREGEIEETINDRTICLGSNDLVVIQPFDVHSTIVSSENAAFTVLLFTVGSFNLDNYSFSKSKYLDLFFGNTQVETGVFLSPFPYQTEISTLLQKLYQVSEEHETGYQMMMKGHLYELISYFQKSGHFLAYNGGFDGNAMIHNICKYVEEHYRDGVTVKEVANAMGYSDAYLSRLFRSATGRTIKSFIDYVRMREAELMLQHETLFINEIASQLGYDNPNSFSRAFKRVTGRSPRAIKMVSGV